MSLDTDKEIIELAQEFLSFDIGIENAKVVCKFDTGIKNAKIIYKLEKDNNNSSFTIKHLVYDGRNAFINQEYAFDKVKVTANAGNAINIDPAIFFLDYHNRDFVYHLSSVASHNNIFQANRSFFKVGKSIENILLKVNNGIFESYQAGNTEAISKVIKINPKNILTTDGKPIDLARYNDGKQQLQFVKGGQVSGTLHAIDLYDYNVDTRTPGLKVGTLPTKLLAVDKSDNQVKLFSWKHFEKIQSQQVNYFTLKYTQNGVVGYFSDENGVQDTTVTDEFKINMSIEDFMSNAKDELVSLIVEELLSTTLSQEIAHKLAHNTRFKRSFKGDDGEPGEQGPEGKDGVDGQNGRDGISPTPNAVAAKLKANQVFKDDVKGEKGDQGLQGIQGLQGLRGEKGEDGKQGISGSSGASAVQVADELINTFRIDTLSTSVAQKSELQNAVAAQLRQTPGKAVGPPGPNGTGKDAKPEDVANILKADEKFKEDVRGEDANSAEIAHKLAHNTRFKRSFKGDDGEKGDTGAVGSTGSTGPQGANAQEVADHLVNHQSSLLGKAVLNVGKYNYGVSKLSVELAKDSTLQTGVKNLLKSDPGQTKGPKGDTGSSGRVGPTGPPGPNGTGQDAKPEDVANILKADEKFKEDVRGEDANSAEIAHRLAHSSRFKRSVKGDDGDQGQQGPAGSIGLQGDPGLKGADGAHGLKGDKGDTGSQGIQGSVGPQGATGAIGGIGPKGADGARGPDGKQGPGGKQGPAGNDGASGQRGKDGAPGEKGEKGDAGPQGHEGRPGSEGEKGEDGAPGPRGRDGKHGKSNADAIHNLLEDLLEDGTESFTLNHRSGRSIKLQKKPLLKVVPGEFYNDNKKEANIKLEVEGESIVIATFLEIGYFLKDDDLYIRDHITGNNMLIPKIFHFLKVVEDGLNSYKLAFCNNLGNLFFEHKKYDSEYAGLSKEHKLIDLKYMKNAANIDLSKYYHHHALTPLFAVKQGEFEGQSLENYRADVYEIERNEKIGTLVDEFGFFDDDEFHYIDHHQGYDSNFQNLNVRVEDHKGNFHIENNTIHPITLDDGLLSYLGYQFN